MAKETAHERLMHEWQNRLGLQDWRITLADNCRPENMSLSDVSGTANWTESTKTARIEMLDEQFYGERIVPYDYEQILVHELLHLKLSLISDTADDLQNRLVHQLIDDLSRALVDAKRSD